MVAYYCHGFKKSPLRVRGFFYLYMLQYGVIESRGIYDEKHSNCD